MTSRVSDSSGQHGGAGRLREAAAAQASSNGLRRIGLGDAEDRRMIEAGLIAEELGIAEPIFIGEEDTVRSLLREYAGIYPSATTAMVLDAQHEQGLGELAGTLLERNPNRYQGKDEALKALLDDQLLYGAAILSAGSLDGLLAGSVSTTSDVIRAGLRGVGLQDGIQTLSSFFLLDFDAVPGLRDAPVCWAFADCGVVIDPTAAQLADIAITTAMNYTLLTATEPRVALLSFSTKGSAHSASTAKLVEALGLITIKAPDLIIDGELQFDAAVVPEVAARKSPQSNLAGAANVFIFPDLDAGNIGYKIAERMGGARAMGPILQGLKKPFNDLSRGAKVDEIVTMIAITALQSSE